MRQVEYAMEQAELEGGNLNLEYYMKLDRSEMVMFQSCWKPSGRGMERS